MEAKKVVRFYNDGKQNLGNSWDKNEKQVPGYKSSAGLIIAEDRSGGDKMSRANGVPGKGKFKVFPEHYGSGNRKILDPGSELVLQWNRVFLFSCLVALFVDPLFFYLPAVVNDASSSSSCMITDLKLGIILTCFRTLADAFYLLHVAMKFRTAYVSPSSRVFGRGELVMDQELIARRYLKSDFFIDAIAALPLPQLSDYNRCILTLLHGSIRSILSPSGAAQRVNTPPPGISSCDIPSRRAIEMPSEHKMLGLFYLLVLQITYLLHRLVLGQIVIWFIIPAIRSSHFDHTNSALVLIVLLQYIPRLYLIFPLSTQIIKATGVVTKTAWAGAAYNLLLYMLASHVLGASWYLLSIERHATCWKSACKHEQSPIRCSLHFLDCGTSNYGNKLRWANSTRVFTNCNPNNPGFFNYGIYGNAVTNNVVSSKFLEKYFYCLWWGLQNLSSYGQTLTTSTFIGETSFAILIAILGLVLFAHLIGNMQTYLQSITVRLEEWRLKRRDTEEWMRHRQLPQSLQERVMRFVQYKWFTTRGVDEESILRALPSDLRRDIQRHLCLDLVRRVPFFSQMDDQLLDAICERLVSSLSTPGTYIVREGDPVTEMLFIIRGTLESSTTNGGRTGFFNSITLRPGDFCGEELLAWALLPKSTLNLPSSTRTVRVLGEVEAFALQAEDLKFVANQFRRLHSKKLQHTFRYYSHHWRAWATCFIQAAWRRFQKRKSAKDLSRRESFSHLAKEEKPSDDNGSDQEEGQSKSRSKQAKQNLGVTILASRFAANTRRGVQKMKDMDMPKLLQKPDEPDFSIEPEDD